MQGITTYKYNDMGKVTTEISPLGSTTEYTYNALGLLKEITDANRQTTSYKYDKLGRITEQKDNLGTIRYTYDANSNVETVTDKSGTIKRTYDALNRVTACTDHKGNTVQYGYDELGNRISVTYPGGEIIRYEYYKNGWLKSVTDNKNRKTEYYVQGNPVSLTDPFGLCPEGGGTNEELQISKHTLLDIAGCIPVIGCFFDLANAVSYAKEKNYTQALISTLSALPGLGDMAGSALKIGSMIVKGGKIAKTAETAADVCKTIGAVGNVAANTITFGTAASAAVKEYKSTGSLSAGTMFNVMTSAAGLMSSTKALSSATGLKVGKDAKNSSGVSGESGSKAINNVSQASPFDLQATHSQTLSKKNMNKLIDDIKNNGINETIKYVEYNGEKYVVDGHHRLIASKRLGLEQVPIEQVELPYAGYKTVEDLLWFD